ncbi:MAG: hypothetical protein R6U63_03655, partial [Longimicrobiales bacterium]
MGIDVILVDIFALLTTGWIVWYFWLSESQSTLATAVDRQTRRSFVRRTGATTAAIGALATAGCLGGDDEEGLDEVDSVEIERSFQGQFVHFYLDRYGIRPREAGKAEEISGQIYSPNQTVQAQVSQRIG